jgi:hypothetical protein
VSGEFFHKFKVCHHWWRHRRARVVSELVVVAEGGHVTLGNQDVQYPRQCVDCFMRSE